MLLTVERVLILKNVSIFSEVPEEQLAEIAAILEEVEVSAGQKIIDKGDIGRSLYVVVHGSVRVHDGDRTIATLGEGEVFGELAALDPEPRSASVSAVNDAHLFTLDHDALYELIAEYVEVARGIIQVLCRRVRG